LENIENKFIFYIHLEILYLDGGISVSLSYIHNFS
jgi:hypothetical protein